MKRVYLHLIFSAVLSGALCFYEPPRDSRNDLGSDSYVSQLLLNISIISNIYPWEDITLTFSEPVNTGSSWVVTIDGTDYRTGAWSSGNKVLAVDPEGYFARGSAVSVSAAGFTAQYDGTAFPEKSASIAVSSEPTASIDPSDGSADIATDSNIIITFSEAMDQSNSWTVTVDGTVYDKNSSEVSWNSNVLTINPSADFLWGYFVTVTLSGFTAQIDGADLGGTTSISFRTPLVFSVSDTGQTGDYTATFGEDSDYADIPNARSFTGPTSHTTYTSDHTTTDNVTGLIWKTCSEGQSGADCSGGSAAAYTWEQAKNACQNLNSANSGAGYAARTDWRLPAIEELITLLHTGTFNPEIDTAYFPGTVSSYYWSSSTNVFDTDNAWEVSFYNGSVYNYSKTDNYYVRCVSGP